MKFEHFIITRFNLRQFPDAENDDYQKWVEWTRNRIPIFRNYTLESIKNQTNKNFTWLLFFDSETPDEFQTFITELNKFDFIKVCYADGSDDFDKNHGLSIKENISEDCHWVVSSRIDNDDSVHKDFVKTIQENFVERDNVLISCASGYTFLESSKKLSHYYYPQSPFLSYIEVNKNTLVGVYHKRHTKWQRLNQKAVCAIYQRYFFKKKRTMIFITKKALWLQVIHQQNLKNTFCRGVPILFKKELTDFSIPVTTTPLKFGYIKNYINYVSWKRYIRTFIIRTFTQN